VKPQAKSAKEIDNEVLERLPYWVRELLAMMEEVARVKARGPQAPSASSSGTP
jgi:hypothetical protein